MAKLYWVTFRLAENAGRDDRYSALRQALWDVADAKWWEEPTSFILFRSQLGIAQIVTVIKTAINQNTDVAIVGMPDFKSAKAVGAVNDDALYDLWDWIEPA